MITFRPLADDDLPMLHGWLNEPGVVAWWEGDDVSWDAVVEDYGTPSTDSREQWIAEADGEPVGWIQCYAVEDEPDETVAWLEFRVGPPHSAGIDYLVGDPSGRGRGAGSAMITAFVDDVVFARHPDWTRACAGPFEANVASWRALEKAGFRHVGTIDDEQGPCKLMVRDR